MYYNMDQVVAQALTLYKKMTGPSLREMTFSAALASKQLVTTRER
jgi:hypothetical protein